MFDVGLCTRVCRSAGASIRRLRALAPVAVSCQDWDADVAVEHFLDAGEQDASGEWDYFYEGDLFTFSAGAAKSRDAILHARIYSDTPKRASFIEQRGKLEGSSLTIDAV